MKADLSTIKLNNIEVPMSFFETNLRVKTKLDELFEKNNRDIMLYIEKAYRAHINNIKKFDYNFVLSCFKYYFCKSVVNKAAKDAFSIKGSRYSFEKNVVNYLTDSNLESALIGKEFMDTLKYIASTM